MCILFGIIKIEAFALFLCLLFFQGELFEILEDDKCLPEEQVQAIAKQLVINKFFLLHLNKLISDIDSLCFDAFLINFFM